MTQGDPVFPKISNLIVDAIIRHSVTVVVPAEAGSEGLRKPIQELVDFSMWMMGYLHHSSWRGCRRRSISLQVSLTRLVSTQTYVRW